MGPLQPGKVKMSQNNSLLQTKPYEGYPKQKKKFNPHGSFPSLLRTISLFQLIFSQLQTVQWPVNFYT